MPNAFTVSLVWWKDAEPLLRSVREAVFIHEQGVPVELEWDDLDAACRHALALSLGGEAIGCGRIMPDGHLGRLSVLRDWRHRRVGSALLQALLSDARQRHLPQVWLDAQIQALPFYRKFDFVEEGENFMDAGIPHRRMRLRL
jgi:predicted GNAT family N-acyltransferase